LGQLTLEPAEGFQSLGFDPVDAEYVMIRIRSNGGGNYVTLGEVEVVASDRDAPPADAHPHAAAVWPNVAAIGYKPKIAWQLLAYLLLTAAEVMVSITFLEFSYTQAPSSMKSIIMSLFLMTVSLGNLFTAFVNFFVENSDGSSQLEATWSFAHPNYVGQNGTADIVITPAAATIVVNGFTGVYDGLPHGATLGSATGVGGADLSASVTLGGETFTNVPGGTATWSFAHPNYVGQNGTADIVITKATATVGVNGYTGAYDGAAHGATGTAMGVLSEALAGLNLGASFTNVPGGTANWVFTDGTGNYTDDAGTAAIVITKAMATVVVNGYTGVYDGAAHGATGTATGTVCVD
jgi:hypothetical protein